eukprot:scaffold78315_cov54-Phaeocystis_antarctica.AAC.3
MHQSTDAQATCRAPPRSRAASLGCIAPRHSHPHPLRPLPARPHPLATRSRPSTYNTLSPLCVHPRRCTVRPCTWARPPRSASPRWNGPTSATRCAGGLGPSPNPNPDANPNLTLPPSQVSLRPGEVPCFWACGVTPQLALQAALVSTNIAITSRVITLALTLTLTRLPRCRWPSPTCLATCSSVTCATSNRNPDPHPNPDPDPDPSH